MKNESTSGLADQKRNERSAALPSHGGEGRMRAFSLSSFDIYESPLYRRLSSRLFAIANVKNWGNQIAGLGKSIIALQKWSLDET
jgi:hypothetical protein